MTNWLLCDFHIHTKYSDGTMEMKDVIDLYGKLGFDCIAITDHMLDEISNNLPTTVLPSNWIKNECEFKKYFENLLEEKERAKKEYNMLVIPGIEYTYYFSNIHIVGIDVKSFIEVRPKIDETLIIAKSQNILLIGAHPWDTRFYKIGGGLWKNKEIGYYIDVWEVGNGVDFFPHVVNNGHRIIGNTDFHGENKNHGIKGWKTLVNSEKNIPSIKQAILDQKLALYKYR